jgi:hypothetical protein
MKRIHFAHRDEEVAALVVDNGNGTDQEHEDDAENGSEK